MLHLMFVILILYAVFRGYTALQMYCWTRWGFLDERRTLERVSPLVVESRPDGKEDKGRGRRVYSPRTDA